MKFFISTCFLLASTFVFAESTLPKGCYEVAIKGESVILKPKNAKLFAIHNLSVSTLWMTHPVSDPGGSGGWTSQLQTGNWSAIVIDRSPFKLNCVESMPGHEQQISCQGTIAVCEWTKVKIPVNLPGSFWASEDLSLSALKENLHSRGFILPKDK
jgi:hypothetical protein